MVKYCYLSILSETSSEPFEHFFTVDCFCNRTPSHNIQHEYGLYIKRFPLEIYKIKKVDMHIYA